MKTVIIISALLLTSTAQLIPKRCTGVFFNDRYYNSDILKEGVNKIHHIAVNGNDNTLYFTFEDVVSPTTSIAYLSLQNKGIGLIEGIRNASGVAIDQARNKVYVGGADGLFLINNYHVPVRLPVNDNIKSLFFKNVLYFTNSRGEAKTFEDGYVNSVKELNQVEVDSLVVDDDNNILFKNNYMLYRIKQGTRAINTHERYKVNYITTDPYFKPYILTPDGVYVYNKYKFALDKVSNLRNLGVLTFSSMYEPIYSTVGMLIKLIYNPVSCSEYP